MLCVRRCSAAGQAGKGQMLASTLPRAQNTRMKTIHFAYLVMLVTVSMVSLIDRFLDDDSGTGTIRL